MHRTSFLTALLLASFSPANAGRSARDAPAAADGQAEPVCSPAWRAQHAVQVSETFRAQVATPEATMDAVEAAVIKAGGHVTQRRQVNGIEELRAATGGDIGLEALIERSSPTWEHTERNTQEKQVQGQCEKLGAARRVRERLQAWLDEDLTSDETQYLTQIFQGHMAQYNRLNQQLARVGDQAGSWTVNVVLAPPGVPTDGRRRR